MPASGAVSVPCSSRSAAQSEGPVEVPREDRVRGRRAGGPGPGGRCRGELDRPARHGGPSGWRWAARASPSSRRTLGGGVAVERRFGERPAQEAAGAFRRAAGGARGGGAQGGDRGRIGAGSVRSRCSATRSGSARSRRAARAARRATARARRGPGSRTGRRRSAGGRARSAASPCRVPAARSASARAGRVAERSRRARRAAWRSGAPGPRTATHAPARLAPSGRRGSWRWTPRATWSGPNALSRAANSRRAPLVCHQMGEQRAQQERVSGGHRMAGVGERGVGRGQCWPTSASAAAGPSGGGARAAGGSGEQFGQQARVAGGFARTHRTEHAEGEPVEPAASWASQRSDGTSAQWTSSTTSSVGRAGEIARQPTSPRRRRASRRRPASARRPSGSSARRASPAAPDHQLAPVRGARTFEQLAGGAPRRVLLERAAAGGERHAASAADRATAASRLDLPIPAGPSRTTTRPAPARPRQPARQRAELGVAIERRPAHGLTVRPTSRATRGKDRGGLHDARPPARREDRRTMITSEDQLTRQPPSPAPAPASPPSGTDRKLVELVVAARAGDSFGVARADRALRHDAPQHRRLLQARLSRHR